MLLYTDKDKEREREREYFAIVHCTQTKTKREREYFAIVHCTLYTVRAQTKLVTRTGQIPFGHTGNKHGN